MSSVVKNPSSSSNVSFSSYCESRVLITLNAAYPVYHLPYRLVSLVAQLSLYLLCRERLLGRRQQVDGCEPIHQGELAAGHPVHRLPAQLSRLPQPLFPQIGQLRGLFPRLSPSAAIQLFPICAGGRNISSSFAEKKSFLSLCSLSKSCVSYRNLSGDDWRVVIGGGGDGEGDNAKQKAASDSEAT